MKPLLIFSIIGLTGGLILYLFNKHELAFAYEGFVWILYEKYTKHLETEEKKEAQKEFENATGMTVKQFQARKNNEST